MLKLNELIEKLERLQPENEPVETARMALLILLRDPSGRLTNDDEQLRALHRDVLLRIQASTDQHSAVADELDCLASSDPCEFSPEHVWTLIRAIKVQSHILQMYLGPSTTIV